MIKLKGKLDWELTRLGLKPEDVIKDHTVPGKVNGAVSFDVYYNGFKQSCVVWPDNYDIINRENS